MEGPGGWRLLLPEGISDPDWVLGGVRLRVRHLAGEGVIVLRRGRGRGRRRREKQRELPKGTAASQSFFFKV